MIGERPVDLGELEARPHGDEWDGGGTGTLSINGKPVAEGRIEKTVPIYFSTDDTFDVGEDWGTALSSAYEPPFRFTGTLKDITITAG